MDSQSSDRPPQQATTTPQNEDVPAMPSIAVALDLAREALTRQFTQADTLNTKAGFILGSASLLTGVLTAWHSLPANTVSVFGLSFSGVRWLPLAAVAIYFLVAATSFMAYRLQTYSLAPDPRVLRDRYLTREEKDTQRAAFKAVTHAFERNIPIIHGKIIWTWIAFGFLIVEAVVTALILLVETAK